MNTKLETITPNKAKSLLKENNMNRPVSDRRVNHYAELMKSGKWHLTHQGIALSSDGTIIDGQHRLHAVIKSNMPIDFNITYNSDKETFKYVDVGYTRTTANIFAIEGIKNYTKHSAGVSKYFTFKQSPNNKMYTRTSRVDNAETHDDYVKFYWENEELLKKIFKASDKYYNKYRIMTFSTIYAYFAFLIIENGHSFEKVEMFFDNVYMIKHNSISNCPSELFQKLINDVTGAMELKTSHKSALINKAWNYFLKGKSVKTFRYIESNENFPSLD